MPATLKQKTLSGVIWSALQKYATVAIRFLSGIILARVLMPADYGYIGMLAIFIVVADAMVDGGFGSALIQKKDATQADCSTIFFWNIGVSLILYLLLFLFAPLIAQFYNMPLLCPILRVQGVTLLIHGATIVQQSLLRKHMDFKKISIVTTLTCLLSFATTIFLAYKGFGVWALVAQHIITALLPCAIYWIICPWRPTLEFSKDSFHQLFGFGAFMFLNNLVNTLCNNVHELLIGRFFSPTATGYFAKAHSTEMTTSSFIAGVLGQVTYPLYSTVQDDHERLAGIIAQLTTTIAFCTFPFITIIALVADPLFLLLYSDRWLPSVPYFQVLCIGGMAVCLQSVNVFSVAAVGKSRTMFRWTIVRRAICLGVMITLTITNGIYGLLWASVFTSWVIYITNAYMVSVHIGYPLKRQLLDLLPILLLTAFCTLCCLALNHFLHTHIYLKGAIVALAFAAIYWALSALFKPKGYQYSIDTARNLLLKIQNIIKSLTHKNSQV